MGASSCCRCRRRATRGRRRGLEGGCMATIRDPEETRAIAIAGMSFGYALAGMLKRMGVLGPDAMENAFEAAFSSVENAFSPHARSAALARQLLDLMGEQLASHVKPLGSTPEPEPPRPAIKQAA